MKTFITISMVMLVLSCPGTRVKNPTTTARIENVDPGDGLLTNGNALMFRYATVTAFSTQKSFVQKAQEAPTNTKDTRVVAYSISGSSTGASIDAKTGAVNFSQNGTFTITATKSADKTYKESKAEYTLTVSDPQLVKPLLTSQSEQWGNEIRFLKMPQHAYALENNTSPTVTLDTGSDDKEGIIKAEQSIENVHVVATFTAADKSSKTVKSEAFAFIKQAGTADKPNFSTNSAPWGTDITFIPEKNYSYSLKIPLPMGVTLNAHDGKISATQWAENVIVVAIRSADEKYEEAQVESDPVMFTRQPGTAEKPNFSIKSAPWGTDITFTPEKNYSYSLKNPAPTGVTLNETAGTVSATGPVDNVIIVATHKADEKYAAAQAESESLTFTKTWVVSTIAGGGTTTAGTVSGAEALFNEPQGMIMSADGATLYVVDSKNNSVRAISTTSPYTVATIAGRGDKGYVDNQTGTQAKFNDPTDITISNDGNILYVTDTSNHRIRSISTTAPYAVSTIAGDGTSENNVASDQADKNGEEAKIPYPLGLAISPDGTTLYLSDRIGIRKITTTSPYAVETIPLNPVTHTVKHYGYDRSTQNFIDKDVTFDFIRPRGMVVGLNNSNIYFVEDTEHALAQISKSSNTYTTSILFGGGLNNPIQVKSPRDIAMSPDGTTLYIPDTHNHRIISVNIANPNTITHLAGPKHSRWSTSNSGDKDGNDFKAAFNAPQGIAVAADGTIYVSDTGNNKIRKMVYR